MQWPGSFVGAGQGHRCELAGLVGARCQFGGDLNQTLIGVVGEPGHTRAEYPILAVAGQQVFPTDGYWLAIRTVGGCQVGSGTTTPNP